MRKPLGHAFEPTQPLEEHRERLRVQRRWRHTPNAIPLADRWWAALTAGFFLSFLLFALLVGRFVWPLGRNYLADFRGAALVLLFVAWLSISLACLLKVLDHYDRRPNEVIYDRWRRRLWLAAVLMLLLAAPVEIMERFSGPMFRVPAWASEADLRGYFEATAWAQAVLQVDWGPWLWGLVLWTAVWWPLCRWTAHGSAVQKTASVMFGYSFATAALLALLVLAHSGALVHDLKHLEPDVAKDVRYRVVAFVYGPALFFGWLWVLMTIALPLALVRWLLGRGPGRKPAEIDAP